jgi:hypothetical protein
MTTLDHYENQLGRAYSWMVGDPQPAPSVQLAAGVLSINRLLAYTRNGNMPISRPVADALNLPQSESDNFGDARPQILAAAAKMVQRLHPNHHGARFAHSVTLRRGGYAALV